MKKNTICKQAGFIHYILFNKMSIYFIHYFTIICYCEEQNFITCKKQKMNCRIEGVLTWICIQRILTDHLCTHRRTYNLGPRFPLGCRSCSGRYTDLKITKQTG